MKYCYFTKNNLHFTETYDSIEETIKAANNAYINNEGVFYGECGTEIIIGVVEDFDMNEALDNALYVFMSSLENDAYEFHPENDEAVFNDSKEFEEKAKEALMPLIKKHFDFPYSMTSHSFKETYDLETNKWIKND